MSKREIWELRELYQKVLYADYLDLNESGAKDILMDLIVDQIERKENRDDYESEACNLVKSIANRLVPIDEDFMKIVGESAHIWDFIIDLLLTTQDQDYVIGLRKDKSND